MDKGRFKYKLLAKYPHLKPKDIAVWELFVKCNDDFFDSVDYDYPVGEGADFLPTGTKTPDERENKLYQRKIDVVGYVNNEVWIIEVKPKADMSTLGQILTYQALAKGHDKLGGNPILAVLCYGTSNEMRKIFNQYNIRILIA